MVGYVQGGETPGEEGHRANFKAPQGILFLLIINRSYPATGREGESPRG